MKVIVIGGGAAGYFTAINIAAKNPSYQVIILEKTSKVLQKVRISGGGRCNVTNERSNPSELAGFYPRGQKKLHPVFKQFSTTDMISWLQDRGVKTKAEPDKRMFPISDSSQTIIDCFEDQIKKLGITVLLNQKLESLSQSENFWRVITNSETFHADKVIVATGSSPATWKVVQDLGLDVTKIVPSLFTFNIKDPRVKDLQGIAFENASVKVAGSKLEDSGPLLITHWGLSGPAILKLSSWGAYYLNEKDYQFQILINFTDGLSSDEVRTQLNNYRNTHPKRKVSNYHLFNLPKRFWEKLVAYCDVESEQPFGELKKKQVNRLVEEISQGSYTVSGKSTFKDEFVTAGGVSLKEVDLATFECKRFPNLYLAGEVLDIDALTGGFNFQACWSVGWLISEKV